MTTFDEVTINNGDTGNVDDCGLLQYKENGQYAHWIVIKRGSSYTGQEDCLLFSYYDGSSWHELLNLDPGDDYAKLNLGKLQFSTNVALVSGDQDTLNITETDGTTPANISLNSIHIKHDVPDLSLDNLVLPTYNSLGNGNIMFEDTTGSGKTKANLYQIRVADPMDPDEYGPGIATDYSFWVEKDIHTYGALYTLTDPVKCAGGGAVAIGPGFYTKETPPCVVVPGEMLVNLVSYSQDFGNNYWETGPSTGQKAYVTNDEQDAEFKAPDETYLPPPYTAWKITCNANCTGVISQSIAVDSTKPYKILSVWLKGYAGGEQIYIRIGGYSGETCTLTTEWKRYNVLLKTPTTTPQEVMFFNIYPSGVFYIWGAQLTESIVPYYWSYVPTTNGPSDEFDTLCLYKMTGEPYVYPLANLKCANIEADGDLNCTGYINCWQYIACGDLFVTGNIDCTSAWIINLYYKNQTQVGCARELSDQVIERKFQTVEDAMSLIKHENNKEWHHIKHGETEGKIVCTCGKEIDASKYEDICPEHKEAWEDRYALRTGDLIEASAKVIPHLLERIEELEKKLDSIAKNM